MHWDHPIELVDRLGLLLSTTSNLQTDAGLEFFNKYSKKLIERYESNHLILAKKAVIMERINSTSKRMMWKEFRYKGNNKWLKMLPKLVNTYNNTNHRAIGMKSPLVSEEIEKISLQTVN